MKRLITSLALAMLLVAVMVMPAMAANPDTTDIDGSIDPTIDVDSPDTTQSLGTMVVGVAKHLDAGPMTVTVYCNEAGWTLDASDSRALAGWQSLGHMDNGVDTYLTNPLYIMGGDQGTYADLSAGDVTLEDGGDSAVGTTPIADVDFEQTATWDDPADTYSITITFTGSLAP